MSDKLKIDVQIVDSKAVVNFDGSIDEDANFDKISALNQDEYFFNFDKVSMINSCGIREWINFLEKLEGKKIIYQNCRQIIIEQMNMVHGFVKEGATIESFYAPYYCEDLDKEYKIHLKADQVVDRKAPKVQCPDDESLELEFDAIEEQYFSFLGKE